MALDLLWVPVFIAELFRVQEFVDLNALKKTKKTKHRAVYGFFLRRADQSMVSPKVQGVNPTFTRDRHVSGSTLPRSGGSLCGAPSGEGAVRFLASVFIQKANLASLDKL